MGKRHRKKHPAGQPPPANSHYENLVKLRQDQPQAYERLGAETHQNVEQYEMGKFAATFRFNPGNESLLELSLRLPEVFARLSQSVRDEVERYGASKRAHMIIYAEEEADHST
jgi:hypothetical protein